MAYPHSLSVLAQYISTELQPLGFGMLAAGRRIAADKLNRLFQARKTPWQPGFLTDFF